MILGGICEVNLVGGEDLIKGLRNQDHLYTVIEKSDDVTTSRLIRTVTNSIHPSIDGPEAVFDALLDPDVAIVSLTVTEKGYCTGAGGALDFGNPYIKKDLENPRKPASAIGVLVEALRRRKKKGIGPFSILSCDNIPENGRLVRDCVLALAGALNRELANWIDQNVTFPSTMVDRIVPAMTKESFIDVYSALGHNDPCGIVCEPFRQWVIEDNFVAGRPDWDKAGALLVDDVLPYEEMKLRMLNGSHSFLAYCGFLAGKKTIGECMSDEAFVVATRKLMLEEQAPTLRVESDLESYADLLLDRFRNSAIRHRTWQIAMDGSQKLPQRALDSMRILLRDGKSMAVLASTVAAWMIYVQGVDENRKPFEVVDPLLEDIFLALENAKSSKKQINALLNIEPIFPPDLVNNPEFYEAVSAAYMSIKKNGSRAHVLSLSKGA